MKSSPGTSLFQNIHVDSIAVEELEAQEDEIRLQKELKDELEHEFGDLDDINGSVDGSNYSASISGCYNSSSADKVSKSQRSTNGSPVSSTNVSNERNSHRSDNNSANKLEVLYDVRLREIEQLKCKIDEMKKKSDCEKFELAKTAKQAQIESRKISESRDEIQQVLVETTSRMRETERDLLDLKKKYSDSESIKRDALHELEMCKMTIRELEQRLKIAERNTYRSDEANFDYVLKELTSKHKQEITTLEKNISNLNHKLNEKGKDCIELEQHVSDLQRTHRNALSEKTETIEKLNANLTKCHSQYQKLLENNKNEEINRLQLQLEQQINENESLRKNISSMNEVLQKMKTAECMNKLQSSSTSDLERRLSASELENSEQVKALQRLTLCLNTKEKELDSVQRKLEAAFEQCQSLKNTVLGYQLEIETVKKENESLEIQFMQTRKEYDALKTVLLDYTTKTDMLHQEQLSELELECSKRVLELESQIKFIETTGKDRFSKMYSDEIDRIATEYMNHFDKLNSTVEKLRNELQREMRERSNLSELVEKLRSELEKMSNKYSTSRKMTAHMKKLVDSRTLLLRRLNEQYVQTLTDLQKGVDEALINGKTEKIAQLIEKSTKNICLDNILDSEEMSRTVCNGNVAEDQSPNDKKYPGRG